MQDIINPEQIKLMQYLGFKLAPREQWRGRDDNGHLSALWEMHTDDGPCGVFIQVSLRIDLPYTPGLILQNVWHTSADKAERSQMADIHRVLRIRL